LHSRFEIFSNYFVRSLVVEHFTSQDPVVTRGAAFFASSWQSLTYFRPILAKNQELYKLCIFLRLPFGSWLRSKTFVDGCIPEKE
jgi:hypothetical protein